MNVRLPQRAHRSSRRFGARRADAAGRPSLDSTRRLWQFRPRVVVLIRAGGIRGQGFTGLYARITPRLPAMGAAIWHNE